MSLKLRYRGDIDVKRLCYSMLITVTNIFQQQACAAANRQLSVDMLAVQETAESC